jgi:hypothetical protein
MGLDAAVFRKREEIASDWLDESVEVDPVTGEVRSRRFHIPAAESYAVGYRLGNNKYIEHARAEIARFAKERGLALPILLDQVLYEGGHSGDIIPLKDVPALKRELRFLAQDRKLSPDLLDLLSRITKLADAAIQHSNPIAFV